MLAPFMHCVLTPKFPRVKLLATASDVSDTDIYTFSAMDIGGFGGGHPLGEHEDNSTITTPIPLFRSPNRKVILAIIHGEDAAVTFNVSSVTIGGVSGTEQVDRGGASAAVNTSVYTWSDNLLAGIANTDVVVTWSEAITACAVGIVEVSNIRLSGAAASGSGQGTGTINVALTGFTESETCVGGVAVVGSTCVTGGSTEFPEWAYSNAASIYTESFAPIQLYHESNAEIDFAAAYYVVGSVSGVSPGGTLRLSPSVAWSGAGNGDAAGIFIL